MLRFILIDIDAGANEQFTGNPDCEPIVAVFKEHYRKVGFELPWVAYFFANEHGELIGGGGFKGAPRQGKVEISYGTFEQYQKQGVATEICRELVKLALETDPSVLITARTLPDNLASMRVLEKNGFVNQGLIHDEEDGEVFEFVFDTKTRR